MNNLYDRQKLQRLTIINHNILISIVIIMNNLYDRQKLQRLTIIVIYTYIIRKAKKLKKLTKKKIQCCNININE